MGNVNSNYSQLMDIARNAYGSGFREGVNGGNGYVGQFTDSSGQTHVVKVLTHRDERKDYAQTADRAGTSELATATQQLKERLIALAGGEGSKLGGEIKKMLEDAQAKAAAEHMTASGEGGQVGLLSRKIVAQAVTAIAQSGTVRNEDDVAFSWDAVNDQTRAATVKDTTTATVNGALAKERALTEIFSLGDRFRDHWRAPLSSASRDDLPFDPLDVASRFIKMSAAFEKTSASKPCGQRLIELFSRSAFMTSLECYDFINQMHGEKQFGGLEDIRTAQDMLDHIHRWLDVELEAGNQGVLAFRALLEKLVQAE